MPRLRAKPDATHESIFIRPGGMWNAGLQDDSPRTPSVRKPDRAPGTPGESRIEVSTRGDPFLSLHMELDLDLDPHLFPLPFLSPIPRPKASHSIAGGNAPGAPPPQPPTAKRSD